MQTHNAKKAGMDMGKRRRTFTNEFKARVALEAVKGVQTASELASKYKVHPTQVTEWKKQLLQAAPAAFSRKGSSEEKTVEELTAPLYEEIGATKDGYQVA